MEIKWTENTQTIDDWCLTGNDDNSFSCIACLTKNESVWKAYKILEEGKRYSLMGCNSIYYKPFTVNVIVFIGFSCVCIIFFGLQLW